MPARITTIAATIAQNAAVGGRRLTQSLAQIHKRMTVLESRDAVKGQCRSLVTQLQRRCCPCLIAVQLGRGEPAATL